MTTRDTSPEPTSLSIRQGIVVTYRDGTSAGTVGIYQYGEYRYATFIAVDEKARTYTFTDPPPKLMEDRQALIDIALQMYQQGVTLVLKPLALEVGPIALVPPTIN